MSRTGTVCAAALIVISLAAGCAGSSKTPTTTSSLMKQATDVAAMLATQLGITKEQAGGSLGSMLTLGKEKLPAGDFAQLAKAVPGAESYMKQAKDSGAVSGPIGNIEGLATAFSKLGIPKETAQQIIPVATTLIGEVGGPEVKQMLSSFLQG